VKLPSAAKIRHWGLAAMVILALGLGLLLHALPGQSKADYSDEDESAAAAPARVTMKNGIATLTLSAADVQNAGIECSPLKPPPTDETVRGFATVLNPLPLAGLNGQYIEAEAQMRSVASKLAMSHAALQRAQILYQDEQSVSAAQLQNTQSSFDSDQSLLALARARLNSVAGNVRQAWGNALGTAVADHLPLIDDLVARRSYLVKVTLLPGGIVATPPQTAIATLYGSIIELSYVSIAASADRKLQGTSYLYEAAARDGIEPGSNLDVTLSAHTAQPGSVVPNSAVVWIEGQAWIYIRTGAGTFVRHKIPSNHPAGDDGYLVTGFLPNDEVVVRGAAMLLSEEYRTQLPEDRT
jgi:hypothetical protein